MKFCHQCGKGNPDIAKFCGYCGHKYPEKIKPKQLDGYQTKPHLELLAYFLKPRQIENVTDNPNWRNIWESLLSEPPDLAIQKFIQDGMLVISSEKEKIDCLYTVEKLKEMCRKNNLRVSGKKADIIVRLLENIPNQIKKEIDEKDVYNCSELGKPIAQKYADEEKERKQTARDQSWKLLTEHNFKEASLVVASYEAKRVFPRGLGIDWKKHNPQNDVYVLNTIFSEIPPILKRIPPQKFPPLRMAAAMGYLWGTNHFKEWIPADYDTEADLDNEVIVRMFIFYSNNKRHLEEMKQSGTSIKVTIMGANDCCVDCKILSHKKYSISKVPILPYEHCTHPNGCRCVYAPIFAV